MKNIYGYYIDLDERGEFSADVRDATGKTVAEISGFGIFEDGFMRNKHDLSGLQAYLISFGVLPKLSQILPMAEFESAVEKLNAVARLNPGTVVQTEDGCVLYAQADGALTDAKSSADADLSFGSLADLAEEVDYRIVGIADPRELAEKFTELLRAGIGDEAFRAVVERNEAETRSGICHSHDFCDANMVMLAAIQDLAGVKSDDRIDIASERLIRQMNEAWREAKLSWPAIVSSQPKMKG